MIKEVTKIEIGKRLKKIRESLHMNKKEFAELIGVKQQYLGTVENGKKGLTVEKVIEICNKTGTSSDYLLLGVDNCLKEQIKSSFSSYDNNEITKAFEIIEKTLILFKNQ